MKQLEAEVAADPERHTPVALWRRIGIQVWVRWRAFCARVDEPVILFILNWLTVVQTVRHMRGLIEGVRHDLDATAREVARWRKLAQRRGDLARLYNQIVDDEKAAEQRTAEKALQRH